MKKLLIIFTTCSILITGCGITKDKTSNNYDVEDSNVASIENSETVSGEKTTALIMEAFIPQYYKGDIYYLDNENNISAINETTGEIRTVIDTSVPLVDFSINENKLFYIENNDNDYTLQYGEMENLETINELPDMSYNFQEGMNPLHNMLIKDNIIYYTENNSIFIIDINKNTKTELAVKSDVSITSLLYVVNDKIYFTEEKENENSLYSISIDKNILTKENSFTKNALAENKNIFYYNNEIYFVKKDSLCRILKIDENGTSSIVFRGLNINKIQIAKDNIFILDDASISRDLFVSNKEDKTKLVDNKVLDFCVGDNAVYYCSKNSDDNFYINKVNLLGEEKESLINLKDSSLSQMVIYKNQLYFTLENGDLHSYNTLNKNTDFIDTNVSSISYLGDNLSYTSEDSGITKIYLPNIQSNVKEEIVNEPVEEIPAAESLNEEISTEQLISNLIIDFDNAWADYVNEKNESVIDYISPNSPINNYLSKFQRDITDEEFLNIDVKAVRIDTISAEVDVDETLRKIINGVEEIKDYKWTYSVILEDSEWKVYNYKKR
jgi:hypothetical protein